MNITILNGSPKGDESVSMQYILYAKKKHPEHQYTILNVAQLIDKIESKPERFIEICNEIKRADGIIWGFPVYVMLVCSQYKRFVELIFEKQVEKYFNKKYTAVLSTSIHFYDHTAQNYIHGICDDLNMNYFGFFAADSWDLLYPDRRKKWLFFFEKFINAIATNQTTPKCYQALSYRVFQYEPEKVVDPSKMVDSKGRKVLILSEDISNLTNLGRMVNTFKNSFLDNVELININDIDIKGPCIGCTKCGYNHECIYKDKDEFTDFWKKKVMQADILIFAGNIKDRFLSSRWKLIYDRAFFNNHTPTIIGKQLGYIISGPLSQIPNLREILQAHVEYQDSNFLGVITDEFGTSAEIDSLLYNFGKSAVEYSLANFVKPRTFLGEAAMKIFRDDVYGRNRFVFLADHEYYEAHGVYNTFPQNDERAKKLNAKLIPLMKIDKVRNKINLKEEFLRPFKKLLEDPNK
jgi:multimeric flavodoxin WrbA